MTEKEFDQIVRYMSERYGIDLSKKKTIIEGRMDNHLAVNGFSSYASYMEYVTKDITGKEAQNMIDILTTNHTFFLREPEHFDFLRNVVLPELREKEAYSKTLRIWCAASSSGEEAYTIAMVIKDFLGFEYENWDTVLLATDISKKVLEEALLGIYAGDKIKGIPERWLRTNFKKLNATEYQIRPEIKKNVMFRQFNLMNPLPFKHKLQVIFLRNVMIYFDELTKKKLLDRIYDALEPGGYLFIGITESIDKKDCRFEHIGTSIYRKPMHGT